jgi:hypothetical protein
VILPTDKLKQQLTIVCAEAYKWALSVELAGDAYSKPSPLPPPHHPSFTPVEAVLFTHYNFCKKYNYPFKANLPYLYPVFKMHKRTINGPKCRFIAGTSTTLKLPLSVSFMKVTGTAATDTKKKRPSSQGKPDSSNQDFDIASIFLAGKEKPKSSLSIASSTLSIALRHVLDVLRAKDLARIKVLDIT